MRSVLFNRLAGVVLAVGVLLSLGAGSAQAGFTNTLVGNVLNQYEDQSREHVFFGPTGTGTGPLAVGDVIVGFIRFDTRVAPGTPNVSLDNSAYALFSQTVLSISGDLINFAPTPVANPFSLQSILTDLSIPVGTIAAIYEVPGGGPFALNYIDTAPGATIQSYLNAIANEAGGDNSWLLAAGWVGAQPPGGNFLQADSTVNPALLTAAFLNSTEAGVTLASFTGGLDILAEKFADFEFFEDVQVFNPNSGTLVNYQLGISGGSVTGASNDPNYANFGNPGVQDKANFLVVPTVIPEPTSVVLLGIGCGGLLLTGRRRPNKERVA